MTGKLVDLGPRVDAAAAFKLLGNLFLMALTAGFADLLALAKAMDVSPAEAATLFEHFNPGASHRRAVQADDRRGLTTSRRGSSRWRARTRG